MVNNMSSGTKHDSGKAPIHFLTREFLEGVAQAQAFGAKKYGDYNFCKGLAYTRLLDAAMRHLLAFTWGENNDNESGESHLSHAAANINMLMYTIKNHPELDDRYRVENSSANPVKEFKGLDKNQFLQFNKKQNEKD